MEPGDLAEWVKKRNTYYDFPPPFTNNFVGAENQKAFFCHPPPHRQLFFGKLVKIL